jgi:hypothetical protein
VDDFSAFPVSKEIDHRTEYHYERGEENKIVEIHFFPAFNLILIFPEKKRKNMLRLNMNNTSLSGNNKILTAC